MNERSELYGAQRLSACSDSLRADADAGGRSTTAVLHRTWKRFVGRRRPTTLRCSLSLGWLAPALD